MKRSSDDLNSDPTTGGKPFHPLFNKKVTVESVAAAGVAPPPLASFTKLFQL
jgi:hypothetical protein